MSDSVEQQIRDIQTDIEDYENKLQQLEANFKSRKHQLAPIERTKLRRSIDQLRAELPHLKERLEAVKNE